MPLRILTEMEDPSEDLLIANKLVSITEHAKDRKFVCSICPDEASFEDWKQHIVDELHVRTLEQFNLAFKIIGAQIYCKLGNVNVRQDSLRAHGISHLLVPWHEPEDKYQRFLKNRIIECNTEFYCCLCEIFFANWPTAYLHIDDQKHQNLKAEVSSLSNELSPKFPAGVSDELLVKNSLVLLNEKTLQCRICECDNVEFTDIVSHVHRFIHIWDKITFASKWKAEKTLEADTRISENRLSAESLSDKLRAMRTDDVTENRSSCQDLPCRYLEKVNNANCRCVVCDCLVFASITNLSIHAAGKLHADSLEKYGCNNISQKEDNTYYCECCSEVIPDLQNVYDHIKTLSHWFKYDALELSRISEMIPKEIKTPTKLRKVTGLPVECFSEKLTDTESPCVICNCEIVSSLDNLSHHLNETNHATALKKYGCDNIIQKFETIFECTCCNCYISGSEKVSKHIKEFKHMDAVRPLNKQQLPPEDKNPIKFEAPEQPKNLVSNLCHRPESDFQDNSSELGLEPLFPNIVSKTIPSNYIKEESSTDHCCVNDSHSSPDSKHTDTVRQLNEQQSSPEDKCSSKFEALKQSEHLVSYLFHRPGGDFTGESYIKETRAPKPLEPLFPNIFSKTMFSTYIKEDKSNDHCCVNDSHSSTDSKRTDTVRPLNEQQLPSEHNSSIKFEAPKQPEHIVSYLFHRPEGDFTGRPYIRKTRAPKLLEPLFPNIVSKTMSSTYIKEDKSNDHCCVDDSHSSTDSQHMDTVRPLNEQQLPSEHNSPIKFEAPKQPEHHVSSLFHRISGGFTGEPYIRKTRAPKPLEPLFPNIVSGTIPSNYIKKENATDHCCVVCDIKLTTTAEINNHVVSLTHKVGMNKYGCDNVSHVNGNLYYCRCCNCKISGNDNVYLHVRGRPHSIELMEEIRKMKLNEPIRLKLSSILTTEVTKMVEEVKAREAFAPRSRSKRGPKAPKVLIDEKTPCSVCSIIFDKCGELHAHMASHFNGDFVPSDDHKNCNGLRREISPKEEKRSSSCVMESSDSIKPSKICESSEKTATNDDNNNELKSAPTKPSPIDSTRQETFCAGNERDPESQSNEQPTRKMILGRVLELMDFDKDCIYDMDDKLRDIELGMKFCLITDPARIYCLICRKTVENTLQEYFEHLRSLDHCNYLERIEKDHELFDLVPEQFSELDLVYEYMEEISDETVICLVCHKEVTNIDNDIRDHIVEDDHARIREDMHRNGERNFQDVKSRMHCDWYNVHNYWCVICLADFDCETSFVEHLESRQHDDAVEETKNVDKTLIYDFCAPCALLWYGYRCTYAYHSDTPAHKYLMRDGHYVMSELPESAKSLLSTSEQYVEDRIRYLDSVAAVEREKEEKLVKDLENAAKRRFYNAKAHTYGSRVSGLAAPDSNCDIFLDCGNMYKGALTSKDNVSFLMKSVHSCLSNDSLDWDLNELLGNCRTPIIRARHKATGLSCDVSFENGLSVENTMLIKSFNDVYPLCRKMVLFLKQWSASCQLSGSDRVSSYALCWFVIFYLQKESIFPSIAMLTRMNSRSSEIAGWEVGITREFIYNEAVANYSLKELLIRFFKFYADFDFRHDVVCPLLGDAVSKREFTDHRNLPKDMRPYIDHMKNSDDSEPLRIDSPMCVQDPIDLQHNITKAVSKLFLSRFRNCCSQSVDLLLGAS